MVGIGRDALLDENRLQAALCTKPVQMIGIGPAPVLKKQVSILIMPVKGVVKILLHDRTLRMRKRKFL